MTMHEQPIGQLACALPGATRIFHQYKLDYCCGGQRSLAQAASAKGLDADAIAEALDLPDREDTPDWQSFGLTGLVDHILGTHHAYLWDELGPLGSLVDKVYSVHGERHPELASVREDYAALANDLAQHLMKEERILFPAIKAQDAQEESGFGCGVDGPIRQMMYEHDAAGEILARLRETTSDYAVPEDACMSYRQMMFRLQTLEQDLHQHIHKENNVLFPRTLAEQPA